MRVVFFLLIIKDSKINYERLLFDYHRINQTHKKLTLKLSLFRKD